MPERLLLPTSVRPVHYNLTLTPDLTQFTFSGFEHVDLNVQQATDKIVLNTRELNVTEGTAYVELEDKSKVNVKSITNDTAKEWTTLQLDIELKAGTKVKLYAEFTGILNDKLAGFYRSSFTSASGEKKFMAVTQFEATDARRAFPCWDEPAIKATFDVSLRAEKNLTALSNMPAIEETDIGNGLKQLKFATTPIMSTYLLAFAVGELEFIEGTTDKGIKLRIYAPPGTAEQGRFALEVGTKTLSFFSDYFDQPYPLPKMDFLAVPDFSAGAMENFGLVTYRTVLILFNEKTTPIHIKQRIAYVVCHELAHQWFGNLVTMEWWTDLWLNEGFATWVGWLAVDHLFPDWNVWEQFLINEMKRALSLDSLVSSHPVEVEVPSAQQVDEIFDAISYAKGASVIRMLVSYLGESDFKKGIRAYIKKYIYSNAATSDLWQSLSEASGKDVKRMMDAWTAQTGFPVVSVGLRGPGDVSVSQHRFLSVGKEAAASDNTKWIIPLRMMDESTNASAQVLEAADGHFPFPGATQNSWFKLNAGQTCFYRVKYDDALVPTLAAAIPKLPAADRVGVVNDAFALASAGYISTAQALTILSAYKFETEYTVWEDISASIRSLGSVWYREPADVQAKIRSFALSLLSPIAKKLSFNVPLKGTESHLTGLLRPIVMSQAGQLGEPGILKDARERYAKFIAGDKTAVHADVQLAIFASVVAHGGAEEFETVKKLFLEADSSDQQTIFLSALGATRDRELIQRALDLSLTDSVRSQDLHTLIGSLASNRLARDSLWVFVKNNWKAYHDRLIGGFLLIRLVSLSTDNLVTEEDAQDVLAFFKQQNIAAIQRNVDQAVEHIRANAAWLQRDKEGVNQWLAENSK